MSVRDDRQPPFIWATLESLGQLEAEWSPDDGVSLGHVRSVYIALIQLAFEQRVRGGMEATESGKFTTPRSDICRKAGISDKPVDNAVKVLERIGLLRVERSGARPSVYTLVEAAAGSGVTPHQGESSATEQVQSSTGETPEPGAESLRTSLHIGKKGKEGKKIPSESPRPRVNRKPVTDAEHDLATAIVAAFNVKAGTRVTVDAHLTPIVGRIREKPELSAEDHRGIITAVFAGDRWWKGPPSPSVIYGNAAQFERSIEVWRAAPAPLRAVEPPVDVARFTQGRAAAEAAWPAIRERMRAALTDSTFGLWIEPLEPAGAAGDTLLLGAPESVVTWVERRYSALITEALEAAGVPWTQVAFTTRPDSSEGERQAA